MLKPVVGALVVVSLSLTGCSKKKEEGGAAAKPVETAKPAEPAAKPAEPAAPAAEKLAAVPADTGVAECDALNPQIEKVNGCAKVSEEARITLKLSVDTVPQVVDMYKNEKDATQKDIAKTALGAACKDTGERLAKALTDAGC